ncbi:hypothetical protein [Streptomyces sp. NBC_01451]|uniref:hypothetical protein n=1 Tax=Streptomyces sp. NBC_01451 TaxID=2903872 RepID=UPI002E32763C|nr:hypothetical protein [Streptomyces sp. NBC_01451]
MLGRRSGFTVSHTSLRHRSTLASSRSSARLAGTCGDERPELAAALSWIEDKKVQDAATSFNMNEVMAALGGAAIGGGFAFAGALAQARSARAQADASRTAARHQADIAHKQWVRSGRGSACFEFLALTLGMTDQAFKLHSWRELLGRRRSLWEKIRTRRAEAKVETAIDETLRQMRATLAVLDLYGPDEVAIAAHRVERACVNLHMCCGGWTRLPPLAPFDWNTDLSAVLRAREEFSQAARPYLNTTV